jgi:hypothetical protein
VKSHGGTEAITRAAHENPTPSLKQHTGLVLVKQVFFSKIGLKFEILSQERK